MSKQQLQFENENSRWRGVIYHPTVLRGFNYMPMLLFRSLFFRLSLLGRGVSDIYHILKIMLISLCSGLAAMLRVWFRVNLLPVISRLTRLASLPTLENPWPILLTFTVKWELKLLLHSKLQRPDGTKPTTVWTKIDFSLMRLFGIHLRAIP